MTEDNKIVVAVNNDENQTDMYVQLPCEAGSAIDLLSGEEILIENGKLVFKLPASSGMIIKIK